MAGGSDVVVVVREGLRCTHSLSELLPDLIQYLDRVPGYSPCLVPHHIHSALAVGSCCLLLRLC